MFELSNQIREQFELEDLHKGNVYLAEQLPFSYEFITNEWLTAVLCSKHNAAEVVSHRLGDRDDGNTNRRRISIIYNKAGKEAGLPTSVFCKASHSLELRQFLASQQIIQKESQFYKSIAPEIKPFEIPRCLFSNYDSLSFNSIIIFEDLAAKNAIFCDTSTPLKKSEAFSQVELLATLHGQLYGSSLLDKWNIESFESNFLVMCDYLDLEELNKGGLLEAEGILPHGMLNKTDKIWQSIKKAASLHGSETRTLLHNDVHIRNWYIASENIMGLADWQCMVSGHWARDLAYAVLTSLTVENRRVWENDLLQYYLECLFSSGGPQLTFNTVLRCYRQQMVMALLWWTATLKLGFAQPKQECLEIIHRASYAIDDHNALASY